MGSSAAVQAILIKSYQRESPQNSRSGWIRSRASYILAFPFVFVCSFFSTPTFAYLARHYCLLFLDVDELLSVAP